MNEKNNQARTSADQPAPVFWDSLLPVRSWQALHSRTQAKPSMERKQLFQNSVEDHEAREQRSSFCTNCGNALQGSKNVRSWFIRAESIRKLDRAERANGEHSPADGAAPDDVPF